MEKDIQEMVDHIATETEKQIRNIAEVYHDRAKEQYEKRSPDYPFGTYFSGYILQVLVNEIEDMFVDEEEIEGETEESEE